MTLMMRFKSFATILFLSVTAGFFLQSCQDDESSNAILNGAKISDDKVIIITQNGNVTFDVKMAVTNEERAKGLMFVRDMPENEGMIFEFDESREVAMWMKNTYISLDMAFIDDDGIIVNIAEHTEPLSLAQVRSNGKVKAVLEVNAGELSKRGVKAGDQIHHTIFK